MTFRPRKDGLRKPLRWILEALSRGGWQKRQEVADYAVNTYGYKLIQGRISTETESYAWLLTNGFIEVDQIKEGKGTRNVYRIKESGIKELDRVRIAEGTSR